jgi:hypothetical protein
MIAFWIHKQDRELYKTAPSSMAHHQQHQDSQYDGKTYSGVLNPLG